MPETIAERRAAPRYALILMAEVVEAATGARLSGRTSDVSRTGCYVDTLNPIAAGSAIRIALIKGGERFEAGAKVVYASARLGMGIQFDHPVPAHQLAILDGWLRSAPR